MSTQEAILSNKSSNEDVLFDAKFAALAQAIYAFKHIMTVEQVCHRLNGLYGMSTNDWIKFHKKNG